jgi:hypothetical protein
MVTENLFLLVQIPVRLKTDMDKCTGAGYESGHLKVSHTVYFKPNSQKNNFSPWIDCQVHIIFLSHPVIKQKMDLVKHCQWMVLEWHCMGGALSSWFHVSCSLARAQCMTNCPSTPAQLCSGIQQQVAPPLLSPVHSPSWTVCSHKFIGIVEDS